MAEREVPTDGGRLRFEKYQYYDELMLENEAQAIGNVIKDGNRDIFTDGSYKSYDNTIYLSGACRVGKSTLASQFIGHEIPIEWKSTDGLMIHFGQNGIDLIRGLMVPLREGIL